MSRVILFLILLAFPLRAQELSTDAFGIFPSAQMGERANWAGYRETSDGSMHFQQPREADAAILFVGPKSIIAGIEPGHAVALALDAHGNMLDGVATEFSLGFGDEVEVETQFGIASHLFRPPPVAQGYLAGATIADVQSARADYRVTAHLATVQLWPLPNADPLLQENFGSIATERLSDAYGNVVEDGVGLSILLDQPNGAKTLLSSVVRDGAARATILSRDIAGPVTGQLALAGNQAGGIRMRVDQLLITDPGNLLIWPQPDIDAINLHIGPIQTNRGYVVPDGTSVEVKVAGSSSQVAAAEGWALDGHVSFILPLSASAEPFKVSLMVLGSAFEAILPVSKPPRDLVVRGAE